MNYYDSISRGYDELYGDEQRKKLQVIKQHIAVSPKTRILDIGCGTGISSDFDCHVVGIDPSEEFITIAREKDHDLRHKFIAAKAEDLASMGFENDEFDYAISLTAMHHVKQLSQVLGVLSKIARKTIISLLKRGNYEQIAKSISTFFHVEREIDAGQDIIYFCTKR